VKDRGAPSAGSRGPIVIPGPPLDASLGLPQAVFRVRRWTQWLQLLIGVGMVVVVVLGVTGAFHVRGGLPILLVLAGPPVGAWITWDAARHLRGTACLVVASEGFEDRAERSGAVHWQDVVTIIQRRPHVRVLELEVHIAKPGGGARTHTIKASEVFNAEGPLIAALDDSHRRWLERQRG
jgi:hypothetical protein